VWLLAPWETIFLCLFTFLIPRFWDLLICSQLVGSFSHLKSFPWNIFYVLTRLVVAKLLCCFWLWPVAIA
jgi:hypothetical protein